MLVRMCKPDSITLTLVLLQHSVRVPRSYIVQSSCFHTVRSACKPATVRLPWCDVTHRHVLNAVRTHPDTCL